METFSSKKVLITGGAGFVGSSLALYLKQRGHEIIVMDNLVRRGSELNVPELRKRRIDFFHGDIRCIEDFEQLHGNIDLLIECSAQPSVVSGFENPRFDIMNNVMGTLECLEFCRLRGAGLIFMSSNRVYSSVKLNSLPIKALETRFDYDPDVANVFRGYDPFYGISADFGVDGAHKSIYGVSKATGDLLCQEWASAFGMNIIVNRCGVIAGEGQLATFDQGWLGWWALAGFLQIPVKYLGYQGKQVRDILFVEDLCGLIELEIQSLPALYGEVLNVGGGRETSISLREATALYETLLNVKMNVCAVDEARKDDIRLYLTDNRHAEKMFGWKPEVSLPEGCERIVRWVRDKGAQLRELYL